MLFAHAWPYDHGVLDEKNRFSQLLTPLHFEERNKHGKIFQTWSGKWTPENLPSFFLQCFVVLPYHVLSILVPDAIAKAMDFL